MKNIKIFYVFICAGVLCTIGMILYLTSVRGLTLEQVRTKQSFVMLTGLPDLALMTEARFIRHRSISDLHSLFNTGPEIRDRFSASFIYAPSPGMRTAAGRAIHDK